VARAHEESRNELKTKNAGTKNAGTKPGTHKSIRRNRFRAKMAAENGYTEGADLPS
jgi:hypothetical protein